MSEVKRVYVEKKDGYNIEAENILNDFSKIEQLPEKLKELNNFKKVSLIEAIKERLNENEYSLYNIRSGKFFIKNKKNKSEDRGTLTLIGKLIYNSLKESLVEHK